MNMEEIIPQQETRGILHQNKTMKTQAIHIDEKKENERQLSEALLNRSDHQRSICAMGHNLGKDRTFTLYPLLEKVLSNKEYTRLHA